MYGAVGGGYLSSSLSRLDEAAIAADEIQVNIPIISLPPDVQVGRVIHGNLQRDYNHELN